MSIARHLPNALTSANLVCGTMGIVHVFQGNAMEAAWFVWASCIFDFFDGFAARWLKVSSPIGKELDSLADVVSFGALPSLVMFQFLKHQNATGIEWLPYAGLLILVFSALRLAKFNIDENQKDSFVGVPTPANALFITGLPFLPAAVHPYVFDLLSLLGITLLFSWLLVAPFELFALKFKNFAWSDNKLRFTFLALAVLLLAGAKAGAISLIILLYIGVSLLSRPLGLDKP